MTMQQDAMTSKERILSALRREEVDYVPLCVAFNPLSAVQRKGQWNFPWAEDAPYDEQMEYQVEQLGLDQVVGVGCELRRPAPGIASRVWLEGDILHKAYTTPAGELHASVRYNELWPCGEDIHFYSDFNIGHFVEPWITNESDLECLKQIMRLHDTDDILSEVRTNYRATKEFADKYGLATLAGVGSGLTGAMQLFGSTELCLMTIENPDLVDAYMEHEHRINLRAIEILGDLGVDMIRRNGFYETADFYGPSTLARFVGPRVSAEADAARAAGMLTSYTIHTGVMPILDYLANLTVDSIFGLDIAFKGVDPETVRDKLAPGKSFWIGPSSTFHLWKGPDATRAAVGQVFEVFGKRGLILAPGVSAHSIMPWESTLAMIDEWKKLR